VSADVDRARTGDAPASGSGLIRLGELLLDKLGAVTFDVVGPAAEAVTAALDVAGLRPVDAHGADGKVDVIVALGAHDGTALESAQRVVGWLANEGAAVVFAAGGRELRRFPAWWDDLFASHGLLAHDVLRATLWDDPSWDGVALTTLTLYARDGEVNLYAPRSEPQLPRSAVHPSVYATLERHRHALDRLAEALPGHDTGADPLDEIVTTLRDRSSAISSTRAQLDELSARLSRELSEAAEATAREVQRADVAEAAAADAAASAAMLIQERDRLAGELAVRRRALTEAPSGGAGTVRRTEDAITPATVFGIRARRAVARRVERGSLKLGARVSGAVPGRIGRLAERATAVYRAASEGWREEARALFDPDYYVRQRPSLRSLSTDLFEHYLTEGWREGLDPHPLFDTEWYVRRNGIRLPRGVNPLRHFVTIGWRRLCDPHPLFDVSWYLQHAPGVAQAGVNPVVHYLVHGWRERLDPHPIFDTGWYLDRHPGLEAKGLNPLGHYLQEGWREDPPSELFDPTWYVANHPEAATSGMPPYRYYLEIGIRRGDPPSRWALEVGEGEPDVFREDDGFAGHGAMESDPAA